MARRSRTSRKSKQQHGRIQQPVQLEDSFATAVGTTQQSIDTQSHFDPLFIPRNKYQRLDLFRKAYEEVSLIQSSIEALVLLTNGDLVGASDDSGVNKEVIEILKGINFSNALDRSLRMYFCYGYSLDELVFDTSFTQLLRIVPVDSRTVYVRKNRDGTISEFLQMPFSFFLGGPLPRASKDQLPNVISIPLDRVMYCNRSPLGDNIYGVSAIQAILCSGLAQSLQIVERSKGVIYQRLAANPQHFSFDPKNPKFQQSESKKIIEAFLKATSERKMDADIASVGWSNEPLFQFGGIDLSKEEAFIQESILIAFSLPPELFGISATSQAKSQAKEKLAVMIDRIQRIRKQREHIINTVLMPQIEATYRLPSPRIKFEQARIVDAKVEAEQYSIWITYIIQILRMGLIDMDKASAMLDLPGVMDRKRADKFLESQMDSMEQPQHPTNEMNRNQIKEDESVQEEK